MSSIPTAGALATTTATTAAGNLPTRWSEQALSERLRSALASDESIRDLPAPTSADVAAIEAWLPQAERALLPCPKDEISRMLTKLATAMPAQRISDDEARQKLAIYIQALDDVPLDVLQDAMKACVRSCMFFPTVAEIRKITDPEMRRRRFLIDRARYHARNRGKAEPLPPPLSKEDRAVLADKMRALSETLKATEL